METRLFDRKSKSTALDGKILRDSAAAEELFRSLDKSVPRFCELVAENGYTLWIGISADIACVQYSRTDGEIPYLMAVRPPNLEAVPSREFMSGGTATPVSGRFCVPLELGIQIASEFIETGRTGALVSWEEI